MTDWITWADIGTTCLVVGAVLSLRRALCRDPKLS